VAFYFWLLRNLATGPIRGFFYFFGRGRYVLRNCGSQFMQGIRWLEQLIDPARPVPTYPLHPSFCSA
jgi:hypothetical protein